MGGRMLRLEALRRTKEEIYAWRERGQGWMEAVLLLGREDFLKKKKKKRKKPSICDEC